MALMEMFDWLELRAPTLKRAHHAMGLARGKVALAGCEVGKHVLVHGPLLIERRGVLSVGAKCVFAGGPFPTALRVERSGRLEVGAKCYFNYGANFEVSESVQVGPNCMFGSYVRVSDARGAPVVFGRDVWVAHGAVINPGVTVGDGAVVSAGSVVTHDVPAGMLAIGNPARMMSQRLCTGGSHA
jgi:acetyltransferase-like isoleucine patch superfamily enzyme